VVRFDGPSWPDPGQGGRVASVVLVLVAMAFAWNGYMRWERNPNGYRAFVDELWVLFLLVVAIGVWRKKRW
jgi:hypothetical protein